MTKLCHALLVSLLLTACGSSADSGTSPTMMPSGAPVATPMKAPITAMYPAFHPEAPLVASSGGKVLTTPKFVIVHYADDALLGLAENFIGNLGSTPYWSLTTKEYGVGPATALPSVAVADAAPTSIANPYIKSWLSSQLDGTHPEFPVADGQTVYIVLYPASTTITNGTAVLCTGLYGYHDETTVGGEGVPYVVVPRCTNDGLSLEDTLTTTLSHELIETALDPLIRSAPAYLLPNDRSLSFATVWGEGEPADLCTGADIEMPGLGLVQRSWSNAASKGLHNPCVPAPAEPNVAAAPVLSDKCHADDKDLPCVKVPIHGSQTIDLQLFSDAAVSDFGVSVMDVAELRHNPTELTFKLDKSKGNNGDVLKLTITSVKAPANDLSSFAVLVAKSGTVFGYWTGFVGN